MQLATIKNMSINVESLIKIIEEENSSLINGKFDLVRQYFDKKTALIIAIDKDQQQLESHIKNNKISADDKKVVKLVKLTEKLNQLNMDNKNLLELNLKASEKVINLYKDMKQKENAQKLGYNKKGKLICSE